jgi:hypothetical protein
LFAGSVVNGWRRIPPTRISHSRVGDSGPGRRRRMIDPLKKALDDKLRLYVRLFDPLKKVKSCFTCGKPHKRKYYCSPECSRQAHYLKFKIDAWR